MLRKRDSIEFRSYFHLCGRVLRDLEDFLGARNENEGAPIFNSYCTAREVNVHVSRHGSLRKTDCRESYFSLTFTRGEKTFGILEIRGIRVCNRS